MNLEDFMKLAETDPDRALEILAADSTPVVPQNTQEQQQKRGINVPLVAAAGATTGATVGAFGAKGHVENAKAYGNVAAEMKAGAQNSSEMATSATTNAEAATARATNDKAVNAPNAGKFETDAAKATETAAQAAQDAERMKGVANAANKLKGKEVGKAAAKIGGKAAIGAGVATGGALLYNAIQRHNEKTACEYLEEFLKFASECPEEAEMFSFEVLAGTTDEDGNSHTALLGAVGGAIGGAAGGALAERKTIKSALDYHKASKDVTKAHGAVKDFVSAYDNSGELIKAVDQGSELATDFTKGMRNKALGRAGKVIGAAMAATTLGGAVGGALVKNPHKEKTAFECLEDFYKLAMESPEDAEKIAEQILLGDDIVDRERRRTLSQLGWSAPVQTEKTTIVDSHGNVSKATKKVVKPLTGNDFDNMMYEEDYNNALATKYYGNLIKAVKDDPDLATRLSILRDNGTLTDEDFTSDAAKHYAHKGMALGALGFGLPTGLMAGTMVAPELKMKGALQAGGAAAGVAALLGGIIGKSLGKEHGAEKNFDARNGDHLNFLEAERIIKDHFNR